MKQRSELTTADQVRQDISRLTAELATLEKERSAAITRASDLTRQFEEGIIVKKLGQMKPAALEEIRNRHAVAQEEVSQLVEEIAGTRGAIARCESDLAAIASREAQKGHTQDRERLLSAAGTLLDAVAVFFAEARGLGLTPSQCFEWATNLANCSDSTRFAATTVAGVAAQVLTRQSDFIAVLIRRLREAAPDLVTPAMQQLADDHGAAADRAFRAQPMVVDAKQASAEAFERHCERREAMRIAIMRREVA